MIFSVEATMVEITEAREIGNEAIGGLDLLEYRRWCARFTIDDTLVTQPQAEASLRAP
jgi:hypothetical protein